MLSNYLSSRTHGRILGIVLSVTLDHALWSSAFEDRFLCQKTLPRGSKKTFHSSFDSKSTLLTTSKIELDAQGRQLRNLTVQNDLVPICCIIFCWGSDDENVSSWRRWRRNSDKVLHHLLWWDPDDETAINNAGCNPDFRRQARTCPYNGSLHILWRECKVLHHPLSRDAADGGRSAPVTCVFVYKIKNWHVWACPFATQSVTGWGTGGVFALNATLRFATAGAVWWPKKSCKLSSNYEINNENKFAVLATFGKRSRNEGLSLT